jgi:hypothetical protein
MKNTIKFFAVAALALAMILTACDNNPEAETGSNKNPAATDYLIGNTTQTANKVTAVTITPKSGKSGGERTVYYNGSQAIPQTVGSYAVTFDVAAATGWNAAAGLSAGTLEVNNNQTPSPEHYTFGNLEQTAGSVTAVTIAKNSGASPGAVVNIKYGGSTTLPTTAGTYAVTFDVEAAEGWNAAVNLSAGNLVVSGGGTLPALTGSVSIDGTAEVGQTLTANTAALGGNGTITYQWKLGSTTIGGNSSTYQVQSGDVGGTITVTVTRSGYSGSKTSTGVSVFKPAVTVPGNTIAAKLVWLANIVESNSSYILEASRDEELLSGGGLSYEGKSNISITLKGDSEMRTLTYASFWVGSGVTFVLDSNITISSVNVNSGGKLIMNAGSRGSAVTVRNGATFTMNGGKITRDSGNSVGGVYVLDSEYNWDTNEYGIGGTFTMNGGEIYDNYKLNSGGGVYVGRRGTFTMNGGEIYDNSVYKDGPWGYAAGGGVYLAESMYSPNGNRYIVGGTFTMTGGKIYGNTAASGAGVYVGGGAVNDATERYGIGGTFTMSGGEISGNNLGNLSPYGIGGGVYNLGTFTMSGNAVIRENEARDGGGVYTDELGTCTISGGTISGNTAVNGGGVYANIITYEYGSGACTMSGGLISGNTATNGGGVYVHYSVSFKNATCTMSGVSISGNTATNGGGVFVDGAFTISSGTISGNTASDSGGGVCVNYRGLFTKTGGTIYGYSGETAANRNTATAGTSSNDKGHAVYVDYDVLTLHNEATAGPSVNLSWDGTSNPPKFSGGWEY